VTDITKDSKIDPLHADVPLGSLADKLSAAKTRLLSAIAQKRNTSAAGLSALGQ
jgi:hypothetical protein